MILTMRLLLAGSGGHLARIDVTSDGFIIYKGCAALDDDLPVAAAIAQPRHFWVSLSGIMVPCK